jgi:hypothetical protein
LRFWPFLFLRLPQPLPTADGNRQGGRRQVAFWARSWSLLGLLFVDTIGAGPFTGLTIIANNLMSRLIDYLACLGARCVRSTFCRRRSLASH